jgi:hypothetical protein
MAYGSDGTIQEGSVQKGVRRQPRILIIDVTGPITTAADEYLGNWSLFRRLSKLSLFSRAVVDAQTLALNGIGVALLCKHQRQGYAFFKAKIRMIGISSVGLKLFLAMKLSRI